MSEKGHLHYGEEASPREALSAASTTSDKAAGRGIAVAPEALLSEAGDRRGRPFLKWAGGKGQLLPHILPRIPRHYNRYIEPFVGAGAVYFAVRPLSAYLADCNTELMNCFQVVRSEVEALIEQLKEYRYDREQYYQVRSLDERDDFAQIPAVIRAARFIYLNRTCFNGLYRVNKRGRFNVPFGRYTNPTIVDAENLRRCSATLAPAILAASSFEAVLDVAQRGDFVYFDPPYAPVSRTAAFTKYAKDGFTERDQELLLLVCLQLHQRGVHWMVSNSCTPLILELYRGFTIERVPALRMINSDAAERGEVAELLIRNYQA
jgi:DNA adenine methylase